MANEVTVTVTRSAQIGGVNVGGTAESLAADYQALYKQTVTAGSTNYEIDFPVTVANIAAFALWSDKNVEVYTNQASTGSPTQHISLKAGATLVSTSNDGSGHQILTNNVTAFFVTNGGSADATVMIGLAAKQAPTGGA